MFASFCCWAHTAGWLLLPYTWLLLLLLLLLPLAAAAAATAGVPSESSLSLSLLPLDVRFAGARGRNTRCDAAAPALVAAGAAAAAAAAAGSEPPATALGEPCELVPPDASALRVSLVQVAALVLLLLPRQRLSLLRRLRLRGRPLQQEVRSVRGLLQQLRSELLLGRRFAGAPADFAALAAARAVHAQLPLRPARPPWQPHTRSP